MGGQEVEKRILIKTARHVQAPAFSADGREIGHDLAHSAVFGREDSLPMDVTYGAAIGANPLRHLLCRRNGLMVSSEGVHVEVTVHELVKSGDRRAGFRAFARSSEE